MEIIKTKLNNLKEDSEEIRRQAKKQTLSYILAGFGLVAGLAWNEAIKSLIEYLFPIKQNTLLAKFVYAVLITLVIVILGGYLTKLLGEKDADKQQ